MQGLSFTVDGGGMSTSILFGQFYVPKPGHHQLQDALPATCGCHFKPLDHLTEQWECQFGVSKTKVPADSYVHAGKDAASNSSKELRTGGTMLSAGKEPLVQDMQKLHGPFSGAVVATGSVVQEDVENGDHVARIRWAVRMKTQPGKGTKPNKPYKKYIPYMRGLKR